MPYKDKGKQKEAGKERVRRYRQRVKGVTSEGVTQGVTSKPVTPAKCKHCGKQLSHAILEMAGVAKSDGCCYDCAISRPKVERTVEEIWADRDAKGVPAVYDVPFKPQLRTKEHRGKGVGSDAGCVGRGDPRGGCFGGRRD